jgi:hypothetical protein
VTFGPISFGPIAPEFLAEEYHTLELPVEGMELLGYTFLALFFCLFPSGGFVARWIRWLAVAYLAALVPVLFFPHSPLDWANRLDIGEVYPLGIAPFYLGFVAAQVYRYLRVSTPAERRQTKWVVFALVVAFGGLIAVLLSAIYARTPWGLTVELISYPASMAYEQHSDARRWRPMPTDR